MMAPVNRAVWISWWQHRCYGDGFAVGNTVRWEVLGDDDPDAKLHPELESAVRRGRTAPPCLRGPSRRRDSDCFGRGRGEIDIVRSEYTLTPRPEGYEVADLVPETVALLPQVSVEPCCRDIRDLGDPLVFAGMIVLLDVLREEPPSPEADE